jgi:hypothetical protein
MGRYGRGKAPTDYLWFAKASEAINVLAASIPYNLDDAFLIPVYPRGLAYLEAGKGRQAEEEFQKLLDHPVTLESDVKVLWHTCSSGTRRR